MQKFTYSQKSQEKEKFFLTFGIFPIFCFTLRPETKNPDSSPALMSGRGITGTARQRYGKI